MPENKKKENELHSGHRERLRNRFLQHGLDGFHDHQMLELLLFYVIPRKDTNEIAHSLLERFGSLSAVLEAETEDLLQVDGIGQNSAALLKLVPAICRAYLDDKYSDGEILNSTEKAGNFLLSKFIGQKDEMVYLVCMDSKCRVQKTELVCRGSINVVAISVRKTVEIALRSGASCVILAHNHPQGTALPSNRDISTTIQIVKALALINVHVNDHIIVAGNDFVSLAESRQHRAIFLPDFTG